LSRSPRPTPAAIARTPDAVETIVERVRSGRQPTGAEAAAVLSLLHVWLSRRRLDRRDEEEVSSEALARLLDVARRGTLDVSRPAGAWLRVVADRLAIDVLRRSRGHTDVGLDEQQPYAAVEDDRIARTLDRLAAMSDIEHAVERAGENGDMRLVEIVGAWLDLAELTGKKPDSRELGELLAISHMTVQRALKRFQVYLAGEAPPSEPPARAPKRSGALRETAASDDVPGSSRAT
jgi:hypothetical protein